MNLSADDHAAPHAQGLQHPGKRRAKVWPRDTDELRYGTSRIQQRPQKIEDRPLTAIGTEAARRSDVFERRMIIWGKEEGEVPLLERSDSLDRGQIDPDSERLKHVCASALRGDSTVSVLGDGDTYAGADQRDGC